MTPPRSLLILSAGALLGMALSTFTPGLLLLAQATSALHGNAIAGAFHAALAAWGALAGALVVRERFVGSSRRSLWLIALYMALYASAGGWYTLVEAAQGGRDAFAALILLGGMAVGVTAASGVVALATWMLLRRFASAALSDSAQQPAAEARLALRAALWLLASAFAQVATGVLGGPVVTGVLVALAAAWFFLRARARFKTFYGLAASVGVAFAGLAVQASAWADEAQALKRAALPACVDGEPHTTTATEGAYGRAARVVPGVQEAIALLRLDNPLQPKVVYQAIVTVRPAPNAAEADVQRAVTRALSQVDCNEGQQLGRVPAVVRAPVIRPIDLEVVVRLQADRSADSALAEFKPKLRAALARTPLSASGLLLVLPSASDFKGIRELRWLIDGNPYLAGDALPSTGQVELPELRLLRVRVLESPVHGDAGDARDPRDDADAGHAGAAADASDDQPQRYRPYPFELLARPVYLDIHSNGLCGRTLAIDSNGDRWAESGCEGRSSGLLSNDRLSDAAQGHFQAALARFEQLPTTTHYPKCDADPRQIALLMPADHLKLWGFCPRALPPELTAVDDALSALGPPSTPSE